MMIVRGKMKPVSCGKPAQEILSYLSELLAPSSERGCCDDKKDLSH